MGPYLTGDISMEAGMLLRSAVWSFSFPPIGLTFCFRKPETSFTTRNVVIGSNKVINKNLDRLSVCTYIGIRIHFHILLRTEFKGKKTPV
jgi:hypothetical protein